MSAASAEAVAAELGAKGIEALPVVADVTQAGQVQSMVDAVMKRWGRLTIGVNNAGIAGWFDSETMPEAEWDKMMVVNLKGVFLCAQAEASVMLPAGYGKIINTASMSAHIANTPQNQAAYNTSKAGVLHMTRSVAAEWAARGVRVRREHERLEGAVAVAVEHEEVRARREGDVEVHVGVEVGERHVVFLEDEKREVSASK